MIDVEISVFKTFNSDPKITTLGQWIDATMQRDNSFADKVLQYRKTGADHLKKGLPLATVGAICENGRKMEDVKDRTGWIALDIDAKDNPHLEDAGKVRDAIANIIYVAYSGLSVSGNGVWALVKVEDPQKQDQYFEKLKKDFRKRGIILDSTKGKNPNDARFYSYDPNAYITDDFKIYDRLPKKPQRKPREPSYSFDNSYAIDDTRNKVESLISKIQKRRIDITPGYENWISLAFALEDEFGENGRQYFHAISQYHSEYNRRETDRQYSNCLKHRGSGISIGTFFHQCREYGITLSHEGNRDNGLDAKYETEKNENPAPHGHNPYTGEVFDERGYPSAWDDIPLDEGTTEAAEATRHAMNDAELEELCRKDPTVKKLIDLFDGEVQTASDLILN